MSNYTIESPKGMVIIRRHTQTITTGSPIAANGVRAVSTTSLTPNVEIIPGYTICGFRAFGNSNNVNAKVIHIIPRNDVRNTPTADHTKDYIVRLHNTNASNSTPTSGNGTFTIELTYIRNDLFTEAT